MLKIAATLPALPVPEPFNAHADWRYTLLTGLLPAIPIALLLPFVPESKAWQERRLAGTLRRPRFAELFSREFRRTTLVTAALSACAYGIAFGALQLTPTRIVPGLPDLAEQQQILRPLQLEAVPLNKALTETNGPVFAQACAKVSVCRELSGERAKSVSPCAPSPKPLPTQCDGHGEGRAREKLPGLTNQLSQLDRIDHAHGRQARRQKGRARARKILGQLGANRAKQERADTLVARGRMCSYGGNWAGCWSRIALAVLLAAAMSKGTLLRLFRRPGSSLPLTYYWLFREQPGLFHWGVFAVGS
jgi:hypothetical protein